MMIVLVSKALCCFLKKTNIDETYIMQQGQSLELKSKASRPKPELVLKAKA